MRRIALVCAVMCLCTTAAVAWGRSISVHPAARFSSHTTHVKPHIRGSQHKKHRGSKSSSTQTSTTASTNSTTASTNASTAGALVTPAAATSGGATLFGDGTVESTVDNNEAGLAEAFPFSATINGTARTMYVYLDSQSTAHSVVAGIYADNNGRPGLLLVSATLSSPRAGAWNAISISATAISASKNYWISVLGNSGMMYFRDRSSGPCKSLNSSQTGLSSLPATWRSGSQWNTCPISAYVSGTATVVSSSDPTPPTTTTSTTPAPPSTPAPPVGVAPIPASNPHVSGTAQEGQTLNTDNGTWLNSPTSYSYQWADCDASGVNCANINGATGTSYTQAASDVGHTIRVTVSASNGGGATLTPATSSQTGVVAPQPAPGNTALPAISGTAAQGQTLTASKGAWTGSPTSYSYQWRDCDSSGNTCSNIAGATAGSYAATSNDVGNTLRVVVTAGNDGGSTSATSAQTAVVSAPAAPTNSALPSVSGTATQGQSLTASKGTWTGSPTGYSYQWRDCNASGSACSNVSGATSSSYTLTSKDVGNTMRVAVTATNAGGSTSATSAQTAVAQSSAPTAPTNTTAPTISGTATQGQTLTASKGTWAGSPTGYAYQWLDCNTSGSACSNISGATASNYTLTSDDVGDTLRVAVTASNAGGAAAASSDATAVVAAGSTSMTNCAGTPGSKTPNTANMDACGFPSPDNTGVPAGTTLTPRTGDIIASTPGQVISGISLTNGTITVTANNVTIENSSITTGDGQLNGTSAIYISDGVTGTVVKNVTMQGKDCQGGSLFAGVMNQSGDQLTMDHDYGNCVDDILHGSGTLSNSYSIDNPNIPNDHYEPVADDGGNGALIIDHDTLLNTHDQTAAVFTQCTFGDVSKLTIANSLLGGGDFAVYGPTSDPCGAGTGAESVTNNRFTRLYYPDSGQYGVGAYFPSNVTWTGNVWDDTNATVPAP